MDASPGPACGLDRRPDSWGWFVLPVLAILASYAVVLTAGFVWDDYSLIVNAPLLSSRTPLWEHFRVPFWNNALFEYRSFYRPLVTLSYVLDHRLWGDWAGGFHLTNVILHSAAVVLLALLCRRAGASRPVACLLAVAFALFPRLTECVAWISGRTDALAAIGVFGALLLYRTGASGGAWARRAAAGTAVLLALLSKEVAVAGVVAVLVLAWQQAGPDRRVRRLTWELVPIWLALGIYAGLRLSVRAGFRDQGALLDRAPLTIALRAGEALARYAGMLLDPLRPRLLIGSALQPRPVLALVGWCIALALVVLLWRYARGWKGMPWIALALGGTALALVMHVIRLDISVSVADRFLYLPVAGLALGMAALVQRAWLARRRAVSIGAVLVLTCFAGATSWRARTWASELRLWHETEASAGKGQASVELAMALMQRGRYREALADLQGIPETTAVPVNRAICLDNLGRRREAAALLESLNRREPLDFNARVNLVLMRARDLRFAEAHALATRITVDFPERTDAQGVIRVLDQVEQGWAALPRESEGESSEMRARRADLLARLGARPEAQARWNAIALDPRADGELRLKGASYLALWGDAARARQALHIVARDPVLALRIPPLAAALQARFDPE